MVYALVVEDEEDIRNPLVEQLQDKGCIVKKADNGAVALKRAAEQTLDIIFVDVNMPVMDGFFFYLGVATTPGHIRDFHSGGYGHRFSGSEGPGRCVGGKASLEQALVAARIGPCDRSGRDSVERQMGDSRLRKFRVNDLDGLLLAASGS